MDNLEDDLLTKLKATFKLEAEERLNTISQGLIELEKSRSAKSREPVIESISREVHSLKGASRAVSMTEIQAVCQSLESVLSAFKQKPAKPSAEILDVLHSVVTAIGDSLPSAEGGEVAVSSGRLAGLGAKLDSIAARQEQAAAGKRSAAPAAKAAVDTPARKTEDAEPRARPGAEVAAGGPPGLEGGAREVASPLLPALSETVRISTEKLNSLLLQVEEMLQLKLSAGQLSSDLLDLRSELSGWKKKWAKTHPSARTLRHLRGGEAGAQEAGPALPEVGEVLEFLDWNQAFMASLEKMLNTLVRSADLDRRGMGGMVDSLLADMQKVLMFPFSTLLEVFPRMVRDLSREEGKEVELEVTGSEVEIDRRILEQVKDPLIHLVRNCIDHGIEKPADRERKGKDRGGTISISINQLEGGKVEITVSDDGAGIDVGKAKAAAIKSGVISREEADSIGDREALSLVFKSEVSTSPIITEVSGRGLGLAIVREVAESLGGNVTLRAEPDVGTTFSMVIPITVATLKGILVRSADRRFVVPAANVEQVLRVDRAAVKTVENVETIPLDGQAVAIVPLSGLLELPAALEGGGEDGPIPVLVIGTADRRVAFMVDEVVSEMDALVKNLGWQLARVRNVSGATILGSGEVVPILNPSDLIKSAQGAPRAITRATAVDEEGGPVSRSVLVAEDSITARSLLKNILETAGYEVTTAVDGLDALTTLKSGKFDLLVTDIQMPRMDGLELTAKVRSEKKLADLPVVIVTGLESREERERGIDVGADAYIVKSSFDQGNLLEVIERLV